MSIETTLARRLKNVDGDGVDDLLTRVRDIDNCYRSLAEKVGQLYMRADEHGLATLTALLDRPMRNASQNEQLFAALLDELRTARRQRA